VGNPTRTDREDAAAGGDRARREDARHLAILAGLGGLIVAILVLIGPIDSDDALAGAGIGLLCAILLILTALPPGDLTRYLGRVKSLSLGSLGIELADYEGLAKLEDGAEDKGPKDPEGDAKSLLDLRLRLEMKLTYLAKHVLATNPNSRELVPTFLTVGSLKHDELLDPEQARIASDILTIRPFEFRALSDADRRVFLSGATRFTDSIRAEVFAKQVEQAFAGEWTVFEAYPNHSKRRDLILQSSGSEKVVQHHVIPVFALKQDSDLLELPLERLAKKSLAKGGGGRFIVVPPRSKTVRRGDVPAGIRILHLTKLVRAIEGKRDDRG
jgi:hypothetical protein